MSFAGQKFVGIYYTNKDFGSIVYPIILLHSCVIPVSFRRRFKLSESGDDGDGDGDDGDGN